MNKDALAVFFLATSFQLISGTPTLAQGLAPHVGKAFLLQEARADLMRQRTASVRVSSGQQLASPNSRVLSSRIRPPFIRAPFRAGYPSGTNVRGPMLRSNAQLQRFDQTTLSVALVHALGRSANARLAASRINNMVNAHFNTNSNSSRVTEIDFIARGASPEDEMVFTRIYYYIYNTSTGTLETFGNRLATRAEARSAGLPVNPIQ